LNAFIEELKKLDIENKKIVPKQLLKYLLGNNDFYKVIKRNNKTEIYGFNLNGTLNKPSEIEKPKFKVPKLRLPSRIIEVSFKPNSTDTIILVCDEGWQVSFRIHNASSKIEPSLKFDINLIGQPQSLYTNHLFW
ncbi:HaeIII family restriction endonuclease, partial [Candidatus Woesearchaeota archaeon]|nr:HaeIII family restriction endonuclease [Candidatus Woesearchaeota archaeon]